MYNNPHSRPTGICKGNINMDLRLVGFGSVNCVNLVRVGTGGRLF